MLDFLYPVESTVNASICTAFWVLLITMPKTL
jgi:hypothetical protein